MGVGGTADFSADSPSKIASIFENEVHRKKTVIKSPVVVNNYINSSTIHQCYKMKLSILFLS
jgi:hypothetical protein